ASGKERLEHNAYYHTVRERVVSLIEQLPAGSTLHLAGHSMGGGMCILLSNDPVVQAALAQRQIQLASVTTLGAVRPTGEWDDVPTVINNQPVTVRHYVDSDDTLAKAVGAGHDDTRYRDTVYELNNHQLDQPSVAHSAYETFDYTRLPEEAQVLPFMVDPAHFQLLAIPALPALPPVEPEWVQEPPLSA
ncbi:lipase family protein, partial [Chloroflexus sp.]|uniref:lipase family protein n=2 Tax=Chloroflexus sp. TaxID=1904827 RepID=UPI003A0FD25F